LDLPYNVDVGPTDFVRWQEQRKHMVIKNEVVATSSSSTGGSAPVMGWRQYVCTHDYFYECSIETFLELEYLDELYGITSFADLLELKSGYGFTPQLTVVGSGPTLVEEWVAGYGVKASGDLTSGYTYCPMPISAPTRDSEASLRFPDEATWSWLPSIHLGHRHEDYEVRNSENGLRQFASGLDLQHLQTWEGVSSFTAAPNPVSATWLQRIYTNPALRNGNHGFNVEVGHGLITYNGWKGLLGMEISGSLNIKGTMYEDDYTGATIP
ncbi:MAG: hypothetical protein FWE76_06835, partial [Symbiobacteriaceae bacterium]|nr:hypothetical protein [Symbiobacteriaceae bacterium]